MSLDVPTVVAVIMLIAALVSARMGRHGRMWRSSYAIILLTLIHFAFLYQLFGTTLGRFGSEEWAAIFAAAIAGIATDDDADAVGLLLIILGVFQVLVLTRLLNI
jgi:hypothetical protein